MARHLFWCIVCDGWRTRDRRLLLLGNDDRAARTTLQFLTYTRRVTLLADPQGGRISARARAKLALDCAALLDVRLQALAPGGRPLDATTDDERAIRADRVGVLVGGDEYVADVAEGCVRESLSVCRRGLALVRGCGVVGREEEFTKGAVGAFDVCDAERELRPVGHVPAVRGVEQEGDGRVGRAAVCVTRGEAYELVRDAAQRV